MSQRFCLPTEHRCCPPAAASICNPFSKSSWHLFVQVSCRKEKLCSPGKSKKSSRSRSAASCPLGRGTASRPGLCMEWSQWESFLSPAQLLLWQKGKDEALGSIPASPGTSHGWAVLQQLLCRVLLWAAQGSALKHPRKPSAKKRLRKSASTRNAFAPPWQEYCMEVNSQRIFWDLILPKNFRYAVLSNE